MNDAANIFSLYLESKEQPKMIVGEYGNKRWYLHGKLHREDGPAYEGIDGTKSWYLHDKRHREDGPAIEYSGGSKHWYLHGERHREDGPAYEGADGTKSWWLHGKHYETPEAWAQALLKQRNKPHDADAINDFLTSILDKYIS